jgi:hypothetical protein
MAIEGLLLIIAGLGALGGLANALMSDNGFILPKRETAGGRNILRPGFLGNAFLGALAAVIFWGLYGPFAEVNVVGTDPRQEPAVAGATREEEDNKFGETLSGLIGALVIGVGGARVITSEVDKRLLQATAVEAAGKAPSPTEAARIGNATPASALSIATSMAPPDTEGS